MHRQNYVGVISSLLVLVPDHLFSLLPGVTWLWSVVTFFPLDIVKFAIRFVLSGRAWDTMFRRTAFRQDKNFGRAEQQARWAHAQRTLHGLHPADTKMMADR